eukprot:scaffold152130_cov14-Tisochrysis_lutea.AAC.1
MSVTSSSSCKFCHPDCKARLQFWMAGKDVTIQEANMRVLYIVPLVHALLCALGCIKIDTPPLWSPSNNLLGPQITWSHFLPSLLKWFTFCPVCL